ncbi:flagellar motor protein [Ammonifex thiophilus]|uniref:Flagellar motor protein n=1 Tax=Ammonifex thiophilus TaxID=444093 RepID=A0A3D8P625_9THEO|nr:flagellar motor protein [Ammonifex thiophilus]RDV84776.1 flagellar motor protein [Ammonifex thiophilus]
MDIATLIGITVGIACLLLGFMLEGGTVAQLVAPSSFIIIFGGTLGATMAGFSLHEVAVVPKALRVIFFHRPIDERALIEQLVSLAEKARREGLLYLENYLKEIESPFLRKGIQLVVDGTEPELVKSIMETELFAMQERHRIAQEIFNQAGGYAPTMGIIGTVMGLIHVLSHLSSPEALGPAIAMAFTATLYGVSSANLIFYPIAARLKNLSAKEELAHRIMLEGLLALQAGNNPILIRERLTAFLSPRYRKQAAAEEGEEAYEAS